MEKNNASKENKNLWLLTSHETKPTSITTFLIGDFAFVGPLCSTWGQCLQHFCHLNMTSLSH
jgi:hypothetical protein